MGRLDIHIGLIQRALAGLFCDRCSTVGTPRRLRVERSPTSIWPGKCSKTTAQVARIEIQRPTIPTTERPETSRRASVGERLLETRMVPSQISARTKARRHFSTLVAER